LTTGLREYRVLTRAACRFVESVRPLHTAVQAKLRQRRFPRSSPRRLLLRLGRAVGWFEV
jgi:hypothetical protein